MGLYGKRRDFSSRNLKWLHLRANNENVISIQSFSDPVTHRLDQVVGQPTCCKQSKRENDGNYDQLQQQWRFTNGRMHTCMHARRHIPVESLSGCTNTLATFTWAAYNHTPNMHANHFITQGREHR